MTMPLGKATRRGTAALLVLLAGACALPRVPQPAPVQLPAARDPDSEWLHYYPAVVLLSGTLQKEWVTERGGDEDDPGPVTRRLIYVLQLDSPIRVVGDPDSERNGETFINESRIQLSLDKNDPDLLRRTGLFVNARAQVRGSLFAGDSPHHHTDVVIRVADIGNPLGAAP